MFVELEFWQNGLTGRNVLMDALRAAADTVVPETVHVYYPDELGYSTDGTCEVSLFFSVGTTDWMGTIDAIRASGRRVKTAHSGMPFSVASGTMGDYYAWADA
jgi:hypothetical protein